MPNSSSTTKPIMAKPAEIDEIAVAAVTDFCARARPSRDDTSRLSDLVMPLIPRLRQDSLRKLSAKLATAHHVPKMMLLALCDCPIAVCSPILTRSACLSSPELLAIISQHGNDHARAIARRRKLEAPVVSALRGMNSPGVDRALDLRQQVAAEPSRKASTETLPQSAEPDAFEAYRETMHLDLDVNTRSLVQTDFDELANLAADPNPVLLQTAIADAVGLTLASAAALCADPTSKNFVYALRFIEAPPEKAYGVIAALAPRLAMRAGVRERFLSAYMSVTADDAVRKVSGWRSDDLMALAREAFAANGRTPGAAVGHELREDARVA